jgi:aspartyl protease family protein
MDSRRIGKGMWVLMWLLVLALLTMVFNNLLEEQRNPNTDPQTSKNGSRAEVVLKRNRYGHYVATGAINDRPVEFLLDTGASDVSVPLDLAERLGLKKGPRVRFETANGRVDGYMTNLDQVQLGDIQLHQVRASINPGMSGDSVLLGMSFLRHIEFTQRGDSMTLRQYH